LFYKEHQNKILQVNIREPAAKHAKKQKGD
jgi:hypothetical protein